MMVNEIEKTKLCACGATIELDMLACSDCCKALVEYIVREMKRLDVPSFHIGCYTLAEFLEEILENGIGRSGQCYVCGKHYLYGGYETRHVDEDCVCCEDCFISIECESDEEAIELLSESNEYCVHKRSALNERQIY